MTVITIIINCTENRTTFFFEVLEELVVIEENKKIYPKSVYKLAECVFLIHFSVTGRIVKHSLRDQKLKFNFLKLRSFV